MSARADALGIDPTIPEDVPQSDPSAVAQGLGLGGLLDDPAAREAIVRETMGDSIADRYGDTLGIRNRGFNDFLRDFAINNASKDPGKSEEMRMRVLDSFREQYQQRLEEGRRLRQEAMQKTTAITDLIERAPKLQLPRKFKTNYIVAVSERIGIPITKEVADLIVDGQIPADVLSMPEFRQALDEDPEGAADMLTQFGADLPTAVEAVDQLQKLKAGREQAAQRTSRLTEAHLRQRERKLRMRSTKLRIQQQRKKLKLGGEGDPIDALLGEALGQGKAPATEPSPEEVQAAEERLGIGVE